MVICVLETDTIGLPGRLHIRRGCVSFMHEMSLMDSTPTNTKTDRSPHPRPWLGRAMGFITAVILGLIAGEVYLRAFPPRDLHEYLGDASPLEGPFEANPDGFPIKYRSYEALREENPDELTAFASLTGPEHSNEWVFFGTSFVHMSGALFDTVGEMAPDQPRFRLDKRETLLVRLAQIEALLEHGYKPKRIIMVLMTIDVGFLGEQSLDSVRVSRNGAMVFEPHMPDAPFDAITKNSRLALTAWIRTGNHVSNPNYSRTALYDKVPQRIAHDFHRLFTTLGQLSEEYDVPVTIIFIPREDQGIGKEGYAFQDLMIPMAEESGIDPLDVRDVFLNHEDAQSLYAPDGHLSKLGNQLVVNALFRHLGRPTVPIDTPDGDDEP